MALSLQRLMNSKSRMRGLETGSEERGNIYAEIKCHFQGLIAITKWDQDHRAIEKGQPNCGVPHPCVENIRCEAQYHQGEMLHLDVRNLSQLAQAFHERQFLASG